MKVLFVNFMDLYGGGEVYLKNVLEGIIEDGRIVPYVITPKNNDFIDNIKPFINKIFIGTSRNNKFISLKNLKNYLLEVKKINKILKNENIETVLLNGESAIYLSIFLNKNVKIIGVKHMLVDNPLLGLKKWLNRKALDKMSKLIVISNAHKEQLNIFYKNKYNDKIVLVYNGIDEKKFKINNFENYKKENITIFESARLTKVKGQKELINVFWKLCQKYNNIRLEFAGIGEEEENLKKMTKELKIDDRVLFRGFVKDMPQVIDKIDIMVLPSYNEGFPLSLLEGMAMEKPLLSTRIAGIPEMIEDGENGYLIDAVDESQLHDKLERLINDEKLRKTMGKKGKIMFEQQFTNTIFIDNVIKEILGV